MIRFLLPVAIGAAIPTTGITVRDPDQTAIRQTIQYYFDGGRAGDSVTLRKAFHPDARMLFVRDSTFTAIPIGEYITRVGQNPPKPGAVDSTKRRIVDIDVAGDAAVAKLELERPDMLVTDYMSLLRIDGQWVIVNKIFSRNAVKKQAAR
jgi:protease I